MVRVGPDPTTAARCPTRSEQLFSENVRTIAVMKDSSRIKRRVNAPSSDKGWTDREPLVRDFQRGGYPKIADVTVFAESVRMGWKSFMWPRPSSPSRRTKGERRSS